MPLGEVRADNGRGAVTAGRYACRLRWPGQPAVALPPSRTSRSSRTSCTLWTAHRQLRGQRAGAVRLSGHEERRAGHVFTVNLQPRPPEK